MNLVSLDQNKQMIEQVPLINDEIIEQLQFLSEDDPVFVHQLIQTLDEEMMYFMDHINGWVQQSDYSTIAKTAHKLRGAAANLGALRLSNVILSVEQAAKISDANSIKSFYHLLNQTINSSILRLKELFLLTD